MKSGDDLRRIAEQLLLLADADEDADQQHTPLARASTTDFVESMDPDVLAELAEALYKMRVTRKKHFPSDLFGEPGWDILLDLFIAKSHGKMVAVTSACIASQVPATTALRWLAVLEDDGWLVREQDKRDRRRTFLRLTEAGERAMACCLAEAGSTIRPVRLTKSLFKGWKP